MNLVVDRLETVPVFPWTDAGKEAAGDGDVVHRHLLAANRRHGRTDGSGHKAPQAAGGLLEEKVKSLRADADPAGHAGGAAAKVIVDEVGHSLARTGDGTPVPGRIRLILVDLLGHERRAERRLLEADVDEWVDDGRREHPDPPVSVAEARRGLQRVEVVQTSSDQICSDRRRRGLAHGHIRKLLTNGPEESVAPGQRNLQALVEPGQHEDHVRVSRLLGDAEEQRLVVVAGTPGKGVEQGQGEREPDDGADVLCSPAGIAHHRPQDRQ